MWLIEPVSEDVKEALLAWFQCRPKCALQINRSCRFTSAAYVCQILLWRKHSWRFNILLMSHRDVCKWVLSLWVLFLGHKVSGSVWIQQKLWQGRRKPFKLKLSMLLLINRREALASSDLWQQLHTILQEAIKVMHFVKACGLSSLLFSVLLMCRQITNCFFCIQR
jgi:hypothetical protein